MLDTVQCPELQHGTNRSEDGTVQQNTAADLDAAVAAAAAALHQEPAPHPAAAVPAGGGPMAYGLLPKPKRNAVLLAVSLAALLVPMTGDQLAIHAHANRMLQNHRDVP